MHKPFSFFSAASVAALLLLTACNNGSTSTDGFGSNCGGPPNNLEVLYPINGATKVNPAITGIYVATTPGLAVGNQYNFLLVQSNGNQQYSSSFAQYTGTIPTPHTNPPVGSTVYVTTILQPPGPYESINLLWNNGGSGCTPNAIVSSFTTGTGTAVPRKQ